MLTYCISQSIYHCPGFFLYNFPNFQFTVALFIDAHFSVVQISGCRFCRSYVHVALFLFLDFSVDQFFIALIQLQFLPFAFFPVNRLPSPIGCTVLLLT